MEYVERILVLILYYVGNSLKKKLLAKKKSIEIIYKSDNYIVINKPHDLLINSSNPENKETVEWRLNAQFPLLANPRLKNRFYFIHRLDYAVSGLLVIGLNKKACGAAAVCFQNRTVSKYYLALVRGHIATELLDVQVPVGADKDELSLSNRMCTVSGSGGGAATPGDATKKCLDAKPARTRLLVMERGIFGDGYPATKVLLKLITGRRHQLRVHCKHLGHTIVGDYTYSNRRDTTPQRTFLHSFRLVLDGGVESFDLSTVDPFEASALRGAWTPVEIVNDLDAGAFRQLESPPPLQYTITT